MKKTIAIAAALMTLLASGCGKVDEEVTHTAGNAPEAEVSAISPVSDSSDASSESCDSSSESESNENMENAEESLKDGEAGYLGTYINDKNCVVISGLGVLDDDNEDEDYVNQCKEAIADKQLLYYSAERLIDQYNCIADRDKRGFFDTIGYSDVFKSKDAAMYWAIDFLDEQDDYCWDGSCMLSDALDYSYYLVGEKLRAAFDKYPEDDNISNTSYTREEVLAEYREIMDEAAEKATFENSEAFIDEYTCFNKLLRRNGSIKNEEYFASPEKFRLVPSDDTIYVINMFDGWVSFGNTGNNVTLHMSVTVLDGDYAYHFGMCDLWLTEKGDHVMPFLVAVCENPYKGKSMEEIGTEEKGFLRRKYDPDKQLTPAEAANEGAYYHFSEGIYEGGDDGDDRTIWEKILDYGSYALSVSDEGLHITPDWDDDEIGLGDDAILSSMSDHGYDSGTVWLRPEPDGSGDFYVIYESPDGQREEYHELQGYWYY